MVSLVSCVGEPAQIEEDRATGSLDGKRQGRTGRSGCRELSKLSEDPGALPVPESHLRLAEGRLKRYREDPSRSHFAFDVLDRLADTSSADSKSK